METDWLPTSRAQLSEGIIVLLVGLGRVGGRLRFALEWLQIRRRSRLVLESLQIRRRWRLVLEWLQIRRRLRFALEGLQTQLRRWHVVPTARYLIAQRRDVILVSIAVTTTSVLVGWMITRLP